MGSEPPALPLASGTDPARRGKTPGRRLRRDVRPRRAQANFNANRRLLPRHHSRQPCPRSGRNVTAQEVLGSTPREPKPVFLNVKAEGQVCQHSLMSHYDVYDNPLITRYASRRMARLWSPQVKFSTWRRLWVAVAEAQRSLGLSITPEQIEALRSQVETIDFAAAEAYERRFRHDVMAHIHALGDAAPSARPIIHLGATSCYVTDNTDLILIRESLRLIRDQLVAAIDALAAFADRWKDLPCLGYTHFQPAQLVTVGKRATLWCQELILDLGDVDRRLADLRFLGVKGTTGTQASFLALFHGDDA